MPHLRPETEIDSASANRGVAARRPVRGSCEDCRVSQPSYQRSASGLVGALLVTLLVIGAFVAFRALNRDELEVGPEAVDYR